MENIEDIIENICLLFDNGTIEGTYNKSKSGISFYVYNVHKCDTILKIRLSDHLPNLNNYINKFEDPPHMTKNINITIAKSRSRLNLRVFIKLKDEDYYLPFSVISYEYKAHLLSQSDIEKIYDSIIELLISDNLTDFIDPLLNNPYKKAIKKIADAKIKYSKLKWVCDAQRNYYRRYLLGDSLQQEYNRILNESLYQLQPYIKSKADANRLAGVLQTFILERYGKI